MVNTDKEEQKHTQTRDEGGVSEANTDEGRTKHAVPRDKKVKGCE